VSTWLFALFKNPPYVDSRHHSRSEAASNSADELSASHATETKTRSAACKKVYKPEIRL
jgi:hypothetical protein